MKATNVHSQEKSQVSAKKHTKVGTWISVGVVGLTILATYFLLYGLYMARI